MPDEQMRPMALAEIRAYEKVARTLLDCEPWVDYDLTMVLQRLKEVLLAHGRDTTSLTHLIVILEGLR